MTMAFHWYQWLAIAGLSICILTCLLHFLRLIRLGKPVDFSRPASKQGNALVYAFTGAMSPVKKESAYLHLPTYTAGIFYHLGTFLSFILFFFILTGALPTGWISAIIAAFLLISALSGLAILIKRIIKEELKSLSTPDDFISNILVTLFQLTTLAIIFYLTVLPSYRPTVLPSYSHIVILSYYLTFTLLTLYIPVGKLRHMVYFFAARYHLGFFFGWRGVWPSGKAKN